MTAPLASSMPVPPQASPNESARRDLQARLTNLGGLNGRKLSPEQKDKKLREACEGFESVFIQKMWQEMRKTLPKGGLLQGREEQFWQDMYDQELAKKMTSAGGIGLADMMHTQLSRNLISASRSTAGGADTAQPGQWEPSAAPLVAAGPQTPAQGDTANDAKPDAAGNMDAGKGAGKDAGKGAQSGAGQNVAQAMPSVYDGVAPQSGVVFNEGNAAQAQAQPQAGAAAVVPGAAAVAEAPQVNPPEVDQALAALRLQQSMQGSQAGQDETTPQGGQIQVLPAGQGARRSKVNSGLELARLAHREVNSKVGPNGVRPPLYPPAPARKPESDMAQAPAGAGAAQNMGQAMPQNMGFPLAQAMGQNMGQNMARAMNPNGPATATPGAGQAPDSEAAIMQALAQGGQGRGGQPMGLQALGATSGAQTPGVQALGTQVFNSFAATPAAMMAAMQTLPGTTQAQAPGSAAQVAAGQAGLQPGQEAQAAAQAAAQAGPQTQKTTFTTNVPQRGRSKRKQGIIRTLNTDAAGPNSRAGAGLAAYHAAQAAHAAQMANQAAGQQGQKAGQQVQPLASTPAPAATQNPAQASAAPAPLTAQSVQGQGSAATRQMQPGPSIPPLTATDLRS